MVKAHRISLWLLLAVTACAGKQSVSATEARTAIYENEFQALFQQVALEVKEHYPNLEARPKERVVKTAWHQMPMVEIVETKDDVQRVHRERIKSQREAQGERNPNWDRRRAYRRENTRRETKHFVRFDVTIEPAEPDAVGRWRVVVTGQASQHDGGIPIELRGQERPYWLDKRISKLEVELHQRLQRTAVVGTN